MFSCLACVSLSLSLSLSILCLSPRCLSPSCTQARKQNARAQKICAVALQQISQYITAWGEVFFQTHQLPALKDEESEGEGEGGSAAASASASVCASSSEHRRALVNKLQGMWQEVRGAQAEWEGQAQVRLGWDLT